MLNIFYRGERVEMKCKEKDNVGDHQVEKELSLRCLYL